MSWCGGGEMRPTPGVVSRLLAISAKTLRHCDWQFARVDKVMPRHAEAAAGALLDGGILGIAVGFQNVTRRVFAAFAGIGFAAEPVHRHGERLVRFLRDGTVAHRAGLEP